MNTQELADTKYKGAAGVAYLRVSTGEQENSMSMQNAEILKYASYKGITLLPEHMIPEPDVSGSTIIGDREEGAKLWAVLRSRKVSHFIIWNLDRLGRNACDIMQAWKTITQELKIVVHVIRLGGDGFSSDSYVSTFIIGILALLAELELDRIKERVNNNVDFMFRNGEQIGAVGFGKRLVDSGRTKIDKKTKLQKKIMLVVDDPAEQIWLNCILDWRKNGWSLQKIANELNSSGVRPKRNGAKWHKATVHNLMLSRHVRELMNPKL